ncbi:MAG: hypothetical protein Q9P01_03005 [Anaerolineae bacterium]|nr:hypothetical protein [Anaerolineae bacterium]
MVWIKIRLSQSRPLITVEYTVTQQSSRIRLYLSSTDEFERYRKGQGA